MIAGELGMTAMGAYKAVRRAIARIVPREEAEAAKQMEVCRLDALLLRVSGIMSEEENPTLVLAAVATALKISERRSRLLGLDGPVPPPAEADERENIRRSMKPILKGATFEELEALRAIYKRVLDRTAAEGRALSGSNI